MKIIKIIIIAVLAIFLLKLALTILGIATAIVFTLFWLAVLIVAVAVIWNIISLTSSSKDKPKSQIESNYIPEMEEASKQLEAQLREIKRKNSVKN